MPPRRFSPLIEAFLIIEQPRQRLSHWITTLAALDSKKAPPLAGITASWDPISDHALLAVRYDEMALGPARLDYLTQAALLHEIVMIQPSELAEAERRRFLSERLARCTIAVEDQRTVVSAVTELARRIREAKKAVPDRAGAPPNNPSKAMRPRTGSEENPVLLVNPKGTRDIDPQRARREVKHSRPIEPLPKPDESTPRMPSPNVVSRHARAATVEVSAAELQNMARSAMASMTPSGPIMAVSDAPMILPRGTRNDQFANGTTPPGIIYARYLRSGRWVPVRIGALSLKGAALLAGALPRVQDSVDVALSYGDYRALVRGPVSKVSSVQEAQMSGAATFSVSFELDEASRRELTTLLTAAREAKVVIKPPPPRSNRRFPVEWPVCLGSNRGAMRANALDVSREGMFVRPQNPLALDQDMMFSAVLDDGASPISGHARVVRHITDADALACGLIAGWGLNVVEMSDEDRVRWNSFLARIEKRSEKRVLIAASPARLAELQAGLAAAGYAVTGGTDAGALVQLVSGESRPVDAAMVDGGWLAAGAPSQWVESLFSARNVPCVTVHGADGRRARATVDKLLGVV
jgi:PilZ domain